MVTGNRSPLCRNPGNKYVYYCMLLNTLLKNCPLTKFSLLRGPVAHKNKLSNYVNVKLISVNLMNELVNCWGSLRFQIGSYNITNLLPATATLWYLRLKCKDF